MEQPNKTRPVTRRSKLKRVKRLKKAAKRRKPSFLRRRYTVGFTLIVFLCFNFLGVSLIGFLARDRSNKTLGQLSYQAAVVAQADFVMNPEVFFGDANAASVCQNLDLICYLLDADVFICDLNGNFSLCRHMAYDNKMLTSGYCKIHSHLNLSAEVIEAVRSNGSHPGSIEKIEADGENRFLVGDLINAKGGGSLAMVFATASVRDELIDYLKPIIGLFFLAEAVALVIAAFIVYRTVRKLTAPLLLLSNAAHSYAQGDFTPRVAIKRNDELGQLAEAFNQMATDLEQLESSRRSFVANVSHELKTPMTTISGFIDGILDGTIPPEKHADYLSTVSTEVKRLSRMVVSMLNLSKIEAGQLDLVFAPVDVKSLLIETTLNFEKQIESRQIDIRGFDIMLPHMIRADRDMITQVVYNLIDNAVKFTPQNGYIAFSASPTEDGERIAVKILNSGVGIPEDEKNRIFERFYKVDKSRSFDKKSSGLGLYIVKSILDLHNGSIRVDSKVGQYSEFIFEVPKDSSEN